MELRNYLYFLVGTLLVISAEGPFASAQQAIVGRVTNEWQLTEKDQKGNQKLQFLHSYVLNANACAEGKGGSLVMLINNEEHSYACDDGPSKDHGCDILHDGFKCVRHIVPAQAGFVRGLTAAVAPLLKEETRYITAVARGLEAEMADSVVPLQGDRVDLALAFREMDPGTYRVRFESLSGSKWQSAAVQLQWSGSGPAAVSPPGIQPGLYRLVRLNPKDEPAGTDAWVLVSGPDRFAKDSTAFQSAVATTRKWRDDLDARAPRAILRAYLDSLSRETKQGQ